jgi:hypothetical protein
MNNAASRNVAVTLAAAGALVVLSDLAIRAMWGSFEVDSPTLFARLRPLWGALACVVPGISVGFFATYRPILLSVCAYTFGTLVSFYRHGGNGSIAVGNLLPERQFVPAILREFAIIVAIGVVMALIGAWLRHRLTIGSSDRGSHLR